MKRILLILFSILSFVFISCDETKDSPIDKKDVSSNLSESSDENILLNASLAYLKDLQVNIKKINEQKIISLKNGDSFYFISIKDNNNKTNAISVQFTGTYNNANVDLDNVLIISCDNEGACEDCVLDVQGDCGVLSCGCTDSSIKGAFDCILTYTEVSDFKNQFFKNGAEILKNLDIPKLKKVECQDY